MNSPARTHAQSRGSGILTQARHLSRQRARAARLEGRAQLPGPPCHGLGHGLTAGPGPSPRQAPSGENRCSLTGTTSVPALSPARPAASSKEHERGPGTRHETPADTAREETAAITPPRLAETRIRSAEVRGMQVRHQALLPAAMTGCQLVTYRRLAWRAHVTISSAPDSVSCPVVSAASAAGSDPVSAGSPRRSLKSIR